MKVTLNVVGSTVSPEDTSSCVPFQNRLYFGRKSIVLRRPLLKGKYVFVALSVSHENSDSS